MRIAIDARELAGKPTGVGRYLRELLAEWDSSGVAGRHDWLLLTHAPIKVPQSFERSVRVVPGTGGTVWEQWTLSRSVAATRPDVLFAPGYTAPLTAAAPVVLTVHDVSFAAHPEWFTWREGTRRRLLTAWSARRARLVLTVSEFSRDQIVTHIGLPRDRIRVIRHGVRRGVMTSSAREPIVLYVGTIFPRRNVDALVHAFVSQVAPNVPSARLEIVGENRGYSDTEIRAWTTDASDAVRARIVMRSYVDDATLAALYATARVFVFPSSYEGFGLTPLEALAAGVPPVVMTTPAATELYGQAARFVSPGPAFASALGHAIVELLTDEAARSAVLDHSESVLNRYRWSAAAAETLTCLQEAAGG